VTGTLGPMHSRWDDERGWTEIVDIPTDGEQTLYAVVWFFEDNLHLYRPNVEVVDETGRNVAMKHLLRTTRTGYEHTGVFATEKPHRGTLRIAIRSRLSPSSRASSGRYAVCVAADATSCLAKGPRQEPVLSW